MSECVAVKVSMCVGVWYNEERWHVLSRSRTENEALLTGMSLKQSRRNSHLQLYEWGGWENVRVGEWWGAGCDTGQVCKHSHLPDMKTQVHLPPVDSHFSINEIKLFNRAFATPATVTSLLRNPPFPFSSSSSSSSSLLV